MMTTTKQKPLLVCLPFWAGDRDQMRELVDIIAIMQERKGGAGCYVMLIARQDEPMDKWMIDRLAKLFSIFGHISTSPLRGWPGGCNGIFGSTAIHLLTSDFWQSRVDTFYWMEADCVPMRPTWWEELQAEWYARKPTSHVVGSMGLCEKGNKDSNHITGCALYDIRIAKLNPKIASCDSLAWDYHQRRWIVANGQDTLLVQNHFRETKAKKKILTERAAVIHGFKDDSLRRLVRTEVLKLPA